MSEYRLLVIEDTKDLAELICTVAVDVGFDARATSNSSEIQSLYNTYKPQVLILDILMPDMDGFEVLRFLHKSGSAARIIILSGAEDYRAMAEKMADGLRLTIDANLRKPFRIKELKSALESIKLSLSTPDENVSANSKI
ncbi:MAG: response regulator [Alphaproteobacteria bacterium]